MACKVLIDFERMKYPNTGLYHFCLHLATNLSHITNGQPRLHYYLPKILHGAFGNNVDYVNQRAFHKFFFPKSNKYTVWHAAQQGTEYFPYGAPCKKILTIHDINFMYDANKSSAKKAGYLKELTKKVNESDIVIAISHFVLKDLLQHIPSAGEKSRVIYNGCNIQEIENLTIPNYAPTDTFLYTIGVIAEKKNFHVLPALLLNNNYKLILSGIVENEMYKNRIIEEAKKYNVANRVIFTGPVSENDKQWYFKNCLAFVFPSLSEGFGLPVIEAMYFGKPTILSTSSSLPEVGGKHAYYFKNFDPDYMNEVLHNSLQHYKQLQPQQFIKSWAKTFSWQKAAEEYLNIYKSLCI